MSCFLKLFFLQHNFCAYAIKLQEKFYYSQNFSLIIGQSISLEHYYFFNGHLIVFLFQNPLFIFVFIMNYYQLSFLFLILIWNVPNAEAVTYIGEDIEKNTKWNKENSPYIITTDIALHKDMTLEIEEGTRVLFSKETSIVIAGNLIAVGSKNQKISFSGLNDNDWNGFIFTKECNDFNPQTLEGCVFDYCTFKGTGQSPAQLIRSKGCNINISNCFIEKCYTAIQTERQAEIWVFASTFENCNRVFNIRNTSIATIENNKITNCNSIMLGGTTTFNKNILKKFSSKGRHSGLIVWMLGGGIVDIKNNSFLNFEDYAIKLHRISRRSSFFVTNNTFKNNNINLNISSIYYGNGNSIIENNDFYNYKTYHIKVTGSNKNENEIKKIKIGVNYWGKLSLPEIKKATLDADSEPDSKLAGQVVYSKVSKKALN